MHDTVAETVDSNLAERPTSGAIAATSTDTTAPRENRRRRRAE